MRSAVPAPALALFLLACGSSQPTQRPPEGQMAPKMDEHFASIVGVHKSIVAGEIEQARQRAGEFTTHLRDADHPPGWHPHLQKVRASLFAVVRAKDLGAAARATARAGHACGQCHQSLGIEALPAGAPPPSTKPGDISDYMALHLWAAESMWNGLVGPSDAAWEEGARALARAGLFPEDATSLTPEMTELAGELNSLGQRAIMARPASARSELYGDFLAACAGCHRLFRDAVD